MGNLHYEAVDYNDPLSIMLASEADDDCEVDVRHSMFDAGLHRAKSYEAPKTVGDWLGASQSEIDHKDTEQ